MVLRGVVPISPMMMELRNFRKKLLHRDEEVVLLAFLCKQVLAVDEVFAGDGALLVGEFLLVQADTATLYHFAHLALRGEDGSSGGEQFDGRLAQLVGSNLEVRHTVEDIEEGLLIEALESFLRCLSEEDVRGFDSHVEGFTTMHHDGDFLTETALQAATTRILAVLLNESIDGFLVQRSKDLDVLLCFLIADVQPELIEAVGAGTLGIELDVTRLGLTELLAVALRDERTGECEGLDIVTQRAADEFRASSHVAPLVVTAELEFYAFMLIEIKEVVALQKLVGELGEGKTVASSSVQALLYAVLCHHVVDGDMLSHLACEVEEGEVLHPVVVVDHFGSVGLGGFEIEETSHLLFNALLVVTQRLIVQQVALLRLSRGVANHTSSTTNEDDGLMTTALQMTQHHDTAEVSDVERVSSGVGAEVGRYHLPLQEFFCARHNLCEHASPFQFFNEVFSHIFIYIMFSTNSQL